MAPLWEKCPGCDDYVCNRHGRHAYDCECPDLEGFIELGIDPYVDPVTAPSAGVGAGEGPAPVDGQEEK